MFDKAAYMRQYRADNAKKIRADKAARRQAVRDEAFARYGTECAHCGFDNPLALVLDHVDNNGAAERIEAGGVRTFAGWNFYAWLKRNDWPDGYQTLCANCNTIKQRKLHEMPL